MDLDDDFWNELKEEDLAFLESQAVVKKQRERERFI